MAIARNPSSNPADGIQIATADLQSGRGLVRALDGVDAIIDCSNTPVAQKRPSSSPRHTRTSCKHASHRFTTCCCPSWARIAVPMAYYKAKAAQERLWAADPHASLVRSTQFHQFAEQMLHRMGLGPVAVIPGCECSPSPPNPLPVSSCRLPKPAPVPCTKSPDPRGEPGGHGPAHQVVPSIRGTADHPGAAGRAIRDGAL